MWKRRKPKKRFPVVLAIFPVIVILLVVFLLYLFIKTGLLTVKKVEVEGNRLGCTDVNQLKDSSALYGKNYLFINSAKIEEGLKKKYLCIKSVMLSKHLPDKVVMQVSGRQPFAALVNLKDKPASSSSFENIATPSAEQVENFYIVDNEGVVFSKDQADPNISKIYTYDSGISLGKNLANSLVASSLIILDKVKMFGISAKENWISDDFFAIGRDPPGPKIIFRLGEKIDIQLASLQLILTEAKINLKELEFIDLRFDKPIVRFAPKK